MDKIKIGIDLDDVLTDFRKALVRFYNEKYGKNISFDDIKSYPLWESGIGSNMEENLRIVNEFCNSPQYDEIPLLEGAGEAVSKLAEKYQIFIITSRTEKYREITERFVSKHFPNVPIEILYSSDFHKNKSKTKAGICGECGISILVEDILEYAKDCSQAGVKVFLLDKPWNQGQTNGRIRRVKGWHEILDELYSQ